MQFENNFHSWIRKIIQNNGKLLKSRKFYYLIIRFKKPFEYYKHFSFVCKYSRKEWIECLIKMGKETSFLFQNRNLWTVSSKDNFSEAGCTCERKSMGMVIDWRREIEVEVSQNSFEVWVGPPLRVWKEAEGYKSTFVWCLTFWRTRRMKQKVFTLQKFYHGEKKED